ncbi:MAG: N-acetyltransferase, partial [Devosia sp.]
MIAPSYSPAPSAPPQAGLPSWRIATPQDDKFVANLQELAFGPGRFARTAYRVRERFPIDTSLSLIAEVDGVPCGSVWMTPISVGGVDGYMLGPLATHPDFRKRGAGKMLARAVRDLALERGAGSFVLLVGDQDYYCPLGWQVTT